ncbi:hypothetical protein FGO68_gene4959 [Halteria grandinella]|uniref:Uncharacterized protein n=1 Tax=Halteria grandinella TaxID=5974 RepID=A0A8J8SV91_HALGN|nr:hypothetical protein FGO68_gene4959 [Halteria grandinella]
MPEYYGSIFGISSNYEGLWCVIKSGIFSKLKLGCGLRLLLLGVQRRNTISHMASMRRDRCVIYRPCMTMDILPHNRLPWGC